MQNASMFALLKSKDEAHRIDESKWKVRQDKCKVNPREMDNLLHLWFHCTYGEKEGKKQRCCLVVISPGRRQGLSVGRD